MKPRARARPRHPVATSTTGRGDLGASLILIFPLLLAYEVGVLSSNRVNGADLVTRLLFAALRSRTLYLAVHVGLAVAFVAWIRHTRRLATFSLDVVAPLVLEAAVYALTLGAVMTLVVDKLLGLSLGGHDVVAALGAGVHEELVFRLGLLTGLVAVLKGRLPIAIALSAVAFSLAHHLAGEPFSLHAFAYRIVAGVAFALIYWYRSLAHAVYAHVLYDLLVVAAS